MDGEVGDVHPVQDTGRPRGEDVDRIRQVDRLRDVVGDEEVGVVLGPRDVQEQALHPPAGLRIEGPEGLVHEDDLGPVDEGASDRHPLLHAAREVFGVAVGELREPHRLEVLVRTLPALRLRHPLEAETVLQVLAHREPAEGGIGLEDHAAVAADARDRLAVEEDLARGGGQEAGDGFQDRRLAAARGAEEDDDLAHPGLVHDVEGDVAHRLGTPPGAVDVGDRDVRHPQLGRLFRRLVAVGGGLLALGRDGNGDGPRLTAGIRDSGGFLVAHAVSLQRKSAPLSRRMMKSVRRPMPPMTSRQA
jgi:hypothetical protein